MAGFDACMSLTVGREPTQWLCLASPDISVGSAPTPADVKGPPWSPRHHETRERAARTGWPAGRRIAEVAWARSVHGAGPPGAVGVPFAAHGVGAPMRSRARGAWSPASSRSRWCAPRSLLTRQSIEQVHRPGCHLRARVQRGGDDGVRGRGAHWPGAGHARTVGRAGVGRARAGGGWGVVRGGLFLATAALQVRPCALRARPAATPRSLSNTPLGELRGGQAHSA